MGLIRSRPHHQQADVLVIRLDHGVNDHLQHFLFRQPSDKQHDVILRLQPQRLCQFLPPVRIQFCHVKARKVQTRGNHINRGDNAIPEQCLFGLLTGRNHGLAAISIGAGNGPQSGPGQFFHPREFHGIEVMRVVFPHGVIGIHQWNVKIPGNLAPVYGNAVFCLHVDHVQVHVPDVPVGRELERTGHFVSVQPFQFNAGKAQNVSFPADGRS